MFALANLFIGIFNVLPVSTLDGGQAINILLSRYFSQRVTDIVINIITIVFSIPIFTMGIIILLSTGYNFSFLLLGVYLFLTPIYNKGIFKR
ncbi:MAG: site-2 protease family protein [Ruminococcus sp.]